MTRGRQVREHVGRDGKRGKKKDSVTKLKEGGVKGIEFYRNRVGQELKADKETKSGGLSSEGMTGKPDGTGVT